MLSLTINEAYLYMGTNAGAGIYSDIAKATQNVLVVSPYMSEEHIDILLKKHVEGVHVTLVTSTDFEGNTGSKTIYRKLITQAKVTNEQTKRYRLIGLVLMYLTLFSSVVSASTGAYLENYQLFWSLLILPFGYLIIKLLNKLRVFSYSYQSNLPFYVMASPNVDPQTRNQTFVNSKIYIIDNQVAYLGSADFTRAGFRDQHETLFRIIDKATVNCIYQEINTLLSDQNRLFRDINFIGKHIYPEPIN
ncbi:MAG: phospholipase D family protein [Gammaproteobacteria bacterium]|nr:phospholipase D family protein [Gammaproteobacteria bacterium]